MKKILYSILFTFSAFSATYAQGPNCGGATAFCSGTASYPATTGAPPAQAGPNYGCLGSQPNPAWFFMQVSTPGNIALTITASPPRDIDFILYGPFTSPATACSNLTAANTEDCSYAGGTAPEIADITGGMAGEYYVLLLTNFSNQPTNVTFSQTSGTGSTSCAVLCDITSLTAVPSACTPATNTYSLSGQIAFTTQPTTGTLTVTSSCGGSQVFNAPFTSPINYNIPGITSNGAACSVTATFSAIASCTQTTNYTAPANCTPCTATANNNGPVCSGSTLGLTAGTVPTATSYSWAGPGGYTSSVQNPNITGSTAGASGTYTVTVTTPSATCTATTTAVVNQTPAAPVAGNNGPICSGSTLNLTASTVPGATYSWTGPGGFTSTAQNPSIPSVTNAATGTYSVTAIANGCTSLAGTTSVIINNTPNPPIPNINGSPAPAPVCAGATLTLTGNNIAGATYSWTGPNSYAAAVRNPPPIIGATPVMSGTYSLTVTVGGCISAPATVTIVINPIPAAPTVANDTICAGGSTTLTATAPGGTYDWFTTSTGGTSFNTGASYTTPVLTDTAIYYVQSTTSGCASPRTAVTVFVSPSFTVISTADDSICSGTSVTLGTVTPVGTFTYSWDEPSSAAFSASANPVVTPAATTTYTVTVTDPLGCTGTDIVTITVGTPLTITASGVAANCFGSCDGTGNVVAAGSFTPYTYNWSTGATTPSVTGLCTGIDTVTVTDLIGCSVTDTIQIQEPPVITLTTASLTSHCNQPDGSASVSVTGGVPAYTYSWAPGGQTNDTAVNLVPGTYTVTVSDSHNCPMTASVTVINTPGVTTVISGTTPITCNAGCDGTATVTASSGITPYTYLWSNGQTTATAISLCASTYTVVVTDSTGCTSSVTVTLTQPSSVFVDALPPVPPICIGQSATLNAIATGGTVGTGYVYSWTAPAFTGNPYIVSPTTTTTYTVSAVDGNGCASVNTQSVTVTVNPPLSVTASNDENICQGNSVLLTAVGTGGDGTYTYTWTPGGPSGPTSSFSASPAVTTTYTVTLTDGCTTLDASDIVVVTVRPLPVVNFSSSALSGCAPLCVTFTDNTAIGGGGSIVGWNWTIDGTTYNTQNPMHCFTNPGVYSITLSDTSNFQCESSLTINNMITVNAMPVAQFIYGPQPASINYPEIQFTDLSLNASSWTWDFGDSLYNPLDNSSNFPNPSHNYTEVGQYCVELKVDNTPACVDSVTHCLIIEPDFTLYIPNAFTPNGSGLNDEFFVKGENIDKFEMQIYDRWGNLVFRTEDIKEHWKGTVKGGSEIAPIDVYVYIINVKDKVGEKHQYIGHVTIVK
jgi:gliding motility-associated-like protein